MPKRVLIITYYWPPAAGAGVFRWLKFVKYLPSFGWEPVVYTPQNSESPFFDEQLQNDVPKGIEVLKQPIWEPYNIYRLLTGKKDEKISVGLVNKGKKKDGLFRNLFMALRGNLLIPDPKVFWVKPSVIFLTNYLKTNPVDVIVTTGPPHSMHLIGLKLHQQLNVKWIADFRDPWTNIDFYKDLKLSWLADRKHHRLERKVVHNANVAISVSEQWTSEFLPLNPQRTQTITNGFDQDDLSSAEINLDSKFSITHVGTLNSARNPQCLWQVLGKMSAENAEFKSNLLIRLVGPVDYSARQSIESCGLSENVEIIDHLPHHEAIAVQQKSQILLLVVNNAPNSMGIIPGKFFEYLSTGRVILGIGPTNGNLSQIIDETSSGTMLNYNDFNGLYAAVGKYYQQFCAKSLGVNSSAIQQYSRKNLTQKLAALMDSL